jgi:peptide/nickel transport system ATP-binding protein
VSNESKLDVGGLVACYLTERGVIRAVDNISFVLCGNESLGIAGESASGKSSLGAAILRMMQPPGRVLSGYIKLNGIDILKLSDSEYNKNIRWKKISMIFQGAMNALDPVFTIGQQMEEILKEHKFNGSFEERIKESLSEVGLDRSIAMRYPHELSGGMKQRVVISMALLLKPDIVIADEPTTALDVLVQAQIISLLKRLKKQKGMTIILITHDLAIISEIADKIAIMYAGQIVEFAKSRQIYEDPKHPYTQALVMSIPRFRSAAKGLHYIKGSPPDMLALPAGCRFYDRCPHAMDVCKQDPPYFRAGDNLVKCWLYKSESEHR